MVSLHVNMQNIVKLLTLRHTYVLCFDFKVINLVLIMLETLNVICMSILIFFMSLGVYHDAVCGKYYLVLHKASSRTFHVGA